MGALTRLIVQSLTPLSVAFAAADAFALALPVMVSVDVSRGARCAGLVVAEVAMIER